MNNSDAAVTVRYRRGLDEQHATITVLWTKRLLWPFHSSASATCLFYRRKRFWWKPSGSPCVWDWFQIGFNKPTVYLEAGGGVVYNGIGYKVSLYNSHTQHTRFTHHTHTWHDTHTLYYPSELRLEDEPPPLPPRNYSWSDIEDSDDDLDEPPATMSACDQLAIHASVSACLVSTS